MLSVYCSTALQPRKRGLKLRWHNFLMLLNFCIVCHLIYAVILTLCLHKGQDMPDLTIKTSNSLVNLIGWYKMNSSCPGHALSIKYAFNFRINNIYAWCQVIRKCEECHSLYMVYYVSKQLVLQLYTNFLWAIVIAKYFIIFFHLYCKL